MDTGILKNGNTWLYQHSTYAMTFSRGSESYVGTSKFTVDSLAASGGGWTFKVIQEDTGTTMKSVVAPGESPTLYSSNVTITRYAFNNGTYSPSAPFFAKEQSYTDTARAIYRGDTVGYASSNYGTVSCLMSTSENVGTVGRTKETSNSSCSPMSANSYAFHLVQYNGQAYYKDSLFVLAPTAIRWTAKKRMLPSPAAIISGSTVLYSRGHGKSALYDAQGKNFRSSEAAKAR
jgi:hypothetical protein